MKRFFTVFLILFLLLVFYSFSLGGTYGKEGNRALGVVYRGDLNSPFGKGEVNISILRREKIEGSTNDDGIYYIIIPKDIDKYQLIYRAKGYWSQISETPIANDHDPEEVAKINLRKMDAVNDSENTGKLVSLLKTEETIFSKTRSLSIRNDIKDNLELLSRQIDNMKKDSSGMKIGLYHNLSIASEITRNTLMRMR